MVVVTEPNEFWEVGKSIRGRTTLVKRTETAFYVKKYSKPSTFSGQAKITVAETIKERQAEWEALAQGTKDAWDAFAKTYYMLGKELYILEGFKEGMTSMCGVAICGQSYCG